MKQIKKSFLRNFIVLSLAFGALFIVGGNVFGSGNTDTLEEGSGSGEKPPCTDLNKALMVRMEDNASKVWYSCGCGQSVRGLRISKCN